jgi:RNA polymerase sigma-70 factor (ECF subfamily)
MMTATELPVRGSIPAPRRTGILASSVKQRVPRRHHTFDMMSAAAEAPEPDDVRLAQGGDTAAFERMYRLQSGAVYALALRLTGNRERALELMQDSFVRAWERLASFRGESAFASWLHRLTVNVFLNQARSDSRRRSLMDITEDGSDAGDVAVLGTDPAERLDLESAIATLPRNARIAFVLHEIEGFSHEEIAATLGVAAATVRSHVFRARHLLMEYLER